MCRRRNETEKREEQAGGIKVHPEGFSRVYLAGFIYNNTEDQVINKKKEETKE